MRGQEPGAAPVNVQAARRHRRARDRGTRARLEGWRMLQKLASTAALRAAAKAGRRLPATPRRLSAGRRPVRRACRRSSAVDTVP